MRARRSSVAVKSPCRCGSWLNADTLKSARRTLLMVKIPGGQHSTHHGGGPRGRLERGAPPDRAQPGQGPDDRLGEGANTSPSRPHRNPAGRIRASGSRSDWFLSTLTEEPGMSGVTVKSQREGRDPAGDDFHPGAVSGPRDVDNHRT